MKYVSLRANPNRSGFIETVINPVNHSESSVFGFWHGFVITALFLGTVVAMRILLGT
jgi:hypothetical protein